ncbi:MAG: hypothetical protein ACK4OO_06650, partial [bacterium]
MSNRVSTILGKRKFPFSFLTKFFIGFILLDLVSPPCFSPIFAVMGANNFSQIATTLPNPELLTQAYRVEHRETDKGLSLKIQFDSSSVNLPASMELKYLIRNLLTKVESFNKSSFPRTSPAGIANENPFSVDGGSAHSEDEIPSLNHFSYPAGLVKFVRVPPRGKIIAQWRIDKELVLDREGNTLNEFSRGEGSIELINDSSIIEYSDDLSYSKSSSIMPPSVIEVKGPFIVRGVRFVQVSLYPLRYDHRTNCFRLAGS